MNQISLGALPKLDLAAFRMGYARRSAEVLNQLVMQVHLAVLNQLAILRWMTTSVEAISRLTKLDLLLAV